VKILPPTLRKKKRYIAFEVVSHNTVSREDLIREIFSAASSLVGDVGSSECEIRLLQYNFPIGIIRCRHKKAGISRAILATVNRVQNEPVAINVLGVSGTISNATQKYVDKVNTFKFNEL